MPMKKYLVEEGPELRFDTSPGGPLINESTCLVMRSKVSEFLVDIVERYSIDTVVSLPRKGTWMIDDAICTFLDSEDIQHLSFGTDCDLLSGARVMVFDDSINTGRGVSEAIDWILCHSPEEIVVASLAITEDTLRDLKEAYEMKGVRFEPMSTFGPYKDFNARGGLRPGCQNYYFAVAILPYINTLNSNRNPGFCNWVIRLEGIHDWEPVFESIRRYMERIGGVINPYERRVAFDSARRITFDLTSEPDAPTKDTAGFSKVRFSLIEVDDHMELSVAPILCPDVIDEGVRIDDVVMDMSVRFMQRNREGILEALGDFRPVDLGTRNLNPTYRGDCTDGRSRLQLRGIPRSGGIQGHRRSR